MSTAALNPTRTLLPGMRNKKKVVPSPKAMLRYMREHLQSRTANAGNNKTTMETVVTPAQSDEAMELVVTTPDFTECTLPDTPECVVEEVVLSSETTVAVAAETQDFHALYDPEIMDDIEALADEVIASPSFFPNNTAECMQFPPPEADDIVLAPLPEEQVFGATDDVHAAVSSGTLADMEIADEDIAGNVIANADDIVITDEDIAVIKSMIEKHEAFRVEEQEQAPPPQTTNLLASSGEFWANVMPGVQAPTRPPVLPRLPPLIVQGAPPTLSDTPRPKRKRPTAEKDRLATYTTTSKRRAPGTSDCHSIMQTLQQIIEEVARTGTPMYVDNIGINSH